VAAGLLLAGCSSSGNAGTIDGWPVGPVQAFPMNVPRDWSQWLSTATAAFDERFPGHAAYVAVTLHDEGEIRDAMGNPVLVTRSGGDCCRVVVFELADGSVHALGIGHLGVETKYLNVIFQAP
jgi:hypothetical protein